MTTNELKNKGMEIVEEFVGVAIELDKQKYHIYQNSGGYKLVRLMNCLDKAIPIVAKFTRFIDENKISD